jgi:DNA-binding transcriptional LysR family regulator
MLNAALAGFGLAYVPEDLAQPDLAKGRLKRGLEDWCPPYSGHHLYYPPATRAGVRLAGRCAALPRLKQRHP